MLAHSKATQNLIIFENLLFLLVKFHHFAVAILITIGTQPANKKKKGIGLGIKAPHINSHYTCGNFHPQQKPTW